MTTESESTNSVNGTISQADGVALGRRLSEVSQSVIGGAGSWKCPEKEVYGPIEGYDTIHTYIHTYNVQLIQALTQLKILTA